MKNRYGNYITQLTDEEFRDAVIICEGDLYEALYYFEGYGDGSVFGKNETRELYNRLSKILSKHGFFMDLSSLGRILL